MAAVKIQRWVRMYCCECSRSSAQFLPPMYRVHWVHWRGQENLCLPKSRMSLTGLVYFIFKNNLHGSYMDYRKERNLWHSSQVWSAGARTTHPIKATSYNFGNTWNTNTVFCLLQAPPLIEAPPWVGGPNIVMRDKNRPIFLNNWPIFNPKPALESSESQLLLHIIRFDLAIAPGASIRQITVIQTVAVTQG